MSEWKSSDIGDIPIEAELKELGECLELIIDHRGKTPRKLGSDWVESGIPAISAKNIHSGSLSNQDDIRYVTKEIYERWMGDHDVETGDCLLVSEGATLGETLIWKYPLPIVLSQRVFCLRVDKSILDPYYFYYYVTTDLFQNQIIGASSGSTVMGLRQSVLLKLLVPVVDLECQKLIGELLYSLDDKIDLLHRQNHTLEQMAEMLFRQWFVEEADEDWEEVFLSDYMDFLEGPGIRNWQYKDEGVPFINIRLIQNGDIKTEGANCVSLEEGNGKYAHFHLEPDDMVMSTSGTLGRTAIVRKHHLPMILNTSVIRFRPHDRKTYSYMYQYLNSNEFYEHLVSNASGSVQLNFGPTHLKRIKMNLPSTDILNSFCEIADGFYDKIKSNQTQIRTLTTLRDTLLPKLMSGEVRVGLAKKFSIS